MKQFVGAVLVVLLVVGAVGGICHALVVDNPIHYLQERPSRLCWLAGIGFTAGLVGIGFWRLFPRAKRRTKLLTAGMSAAFIFLSGGCFIVLVATLPLRWRLVALSSVACLIVIAGMLLRASVNRKEFRIVTETRCAHCGSILGREAMRKGQNIYNERTKKRFKEARVKGMLNRMFVEWPVLCATCGQTSFFYPQDNQIEKQSRISKPHRGEATGEKSDSLGVA